MKFSWTNGCFRLEQNIAAQKTMNCQFSHANGFSITNTRPERIEGVGEVGAKLGDGGGRVGKDIERDKRGKNGH